MTTAQVTAGNIARCTVVFAPLTGTVALADVTGRYRTQQGVEGTLTGIIATVAVTNGFQADLQVPDNTPSGWWQVRWESNLPSPKIAVEDLTTRFIVLASRLAVP